MIQTNVHQFKTGIMYIFMYKVIFFKYQQRNADNLEKKIKSALVKKCWSFLCKGATDTDDSTERLQLSQGL